MTGSSLFLSLLALSLVATAPAVGRTLEGLLRHDLVERQIYTSCVTPDWIPCTSYISERGCRPPGGTCCIDGRFCRTGFYCTVVPGQAKGDCCPEGTTCGDQKRECKTAGYSICSELDFCCGPNSVCAHNSTGTGSTCLLNYFVGTTSTTTSHSSTTSESSTSSATPTVPTAAPQTFSTETNAGAIAGGVVGGLAIVLLAIVAFWYFWRKKRTETVAATGGNGMSGPGPASPMMGPKFGSPPMVAGLGYSAAPNPTGQGQMSSQSYLGPQGLSHSASAATTPYTGSPPGSPPMPYPVIPTNGLSLVPPSPRASYNGTPEIHDASRTRFPNPSIPSPSHGSPVRSSENSGISPTGSPGVGGFYYNSAVTSPAVGANIGGFNPALASPSGSPTAQRFSNQPPTGPNTPLTGNSEQGLFAHAQAQGYGQR